MLANVKSFATRGGAIIPPESLLGARSGVPIASEVTLAVFD
jgi:hypothetical protein